jgi:hypothetical protein
VALSSDSAPVEDAASLLGTASVVVEVCVAVSLMDANVCSEALEDDDVRPNT